VIERGGVLGEKVFCKRTFFTKEHTTMQEVNGSTIALPGSRESLQEILRQGAQKMLAQAIEAEVAEWIEQHAHVTDEQGRRQVVRNGRLPERKIVTGVGEVAIEQPRVHDRRGSGDHERFSSKLLPPYLRKTKSIEELIPYLYLKGISTGGFHDALAAILGPDCPGLSATTVTRLKTVWEQEYREWSSRSLEGKEYVYVWADGIYTNIRLEDDRQCILVLMGATKDGKKELIAMTDGHRESAQSWRELLLDVKRRGLSVAPKLAIGDGALGFWKALAEVFPATKEQRCWVHKTANVLDKLPKNKQPKAKDMLHQSGWLTRARQRVNRSTPSWSLIRPSTRRRRNAWPRTATCCSRSTTSPPNTGGTCGPRIQSSRPLPPSACDTDARKATAVALPP
jgi:putative transposase